VIRRCIVMVLVAFFIIVACAARSGKRPAEITERVAGAEALRPFGEYAYLLFCAGC